MSDKQDYTQEQLDRLVTYEQMLKKLAGMQAVYAAFAAEKARVEKALKEHYGVSTARAVKDLEEEIKVFALQLHEDGVKAIFPLEAVAGSEVVITDETRLIRWMVRNKFDEIIAYDSKDYTPKLDADGELKIERLVKLGNLNLIRGLLRSAAERRIEGLPMEVRAIKKAQWVDDGGWQESYDTSIPDPLYEELS